MTATQLSTLVLLSTAAGCSNIERSRNLADPLVAATTIAQQVCSNCHGMDGNAVSPNFPNLAGQPKEYLVAQLEHFRDRTRTDKAAIQYMWGLARSLTDAQIAGLAEYFAAQSPKVPRPLATAVAPKGEDIYRHGLPAERIPACTACHGDRAEGLGAAPRLANQPTDYTFKQLVAYQSTDQRPDQGVMRAMLHGLGTPDLKALADYLAAMPAAVPDRTAHAESYASEVSSGSPKKALPVPD